MFKKAARLRYIGDKLICAKWTPWARQKFRALDDESRPVFAKQFDLGEVLIKLHRIGEIRNITFLVLEKLGLVCIPTYTDGEPYGPTEAPYGWGTPFIDEEGMPLNNGLGTITEDDSYSNSPYNLVIRNPRASRVTEPAQLLIRNTKHIDKPWVSDTPHAYGVDGGWNRGNDGYTWSTPPLSNTGWIFKKGVPVFDRLVADEAILAASTFEGRQIFITGDDTYLHVYENGVLYESVPYTIPSIGQAHVSPYGSMFVFLSSSGVYRISLAIEVNPETLEEYMVVGHQEVATAVMEVDRNLSITNTHWFRADAYTNDGGGFVSFWPGEWDDYLGGGCDYGFTQNDWTEHVSDTVDAVTFSQQVAVIWQINAQGAEVEFPVIAERTYSFSHTMDTTQYRLHNAGTEGNDPWDDSWTGLDMPPNYRYDQQTDMEYSTNLSDETVLKLPDEEIVIQARYLTETGDYQDIRDDILDGSPSFSPEGYWDTYRNSGATLVEIDSDITLSDDMKVIDIAIRKVTRTYSYSFHYDAFIDGDNDNGGSVTVYTVSLTLSCNSEYTRRQLTLDGTDIDDVVDSIIVSTSIPKSSSSNTPYSATSSQVNSMFLFGSASFPLFFGRVTPNTIGCRYVPWPTDFYVADLDPDETGHGALYPTSPVMNAHETYEDSNLVGNRAPEYGWGGGERTTTLNYSKRVRLGFDIDLIDNPMAHLGQDHAQRDDVLLYQKKQKTRPLGDLVPTEEEDGFETTYDYATDVPVMYLSGVGETLATQDFFGLGAYPLADLALKYKSFL